jgi:orotate phosphoribosyltransferase
MMPTVDVERLLEESGAILRGHFLLTSGRHSDVYFEKFRILERPDVLSALCSAIADRYRSAGIELVAGPTTGGIIIAFEVARQLGVRAIYVEAEEGKKRLRRGAAVAPGARTLIVDDVLTTGLSLREVEEVLVTAGADPVGIAVLIDRSEGELNLRQPLFSSYKIEAKSYTEEEAPDWLLAIPITKPGTRAS